MIRASLKLRTPSFRVSKSLLKSVEPDNEGLKGLRIKTAIHPRTANFLVEYEGKIETFISTLDDMLACLQVAKRTLSDMRRKLE